MPISRAEIPTASGRNLIKRLCKHWAHKLKVEHDEGRGRVHFDAGTCLMEADGERLVVAIEALHVEGLDALEGVVASHLERMAGDEPLTIVWEN
ncbi:DUF2218 domain-containing protein [Halomonas sp. YLGW01]|uniref:DUF2218 domain-containing protein n=1 Tax=Halomonas sp. YLGW01 TaxID=2773308 RepID=UPI00177EADC9|nr:DUF2218 domain-containing protein [Halomonas sp. YLGW01]